MPWLTLDTDRFHYIGVVRRPFHCKFYTQAYPNGNELGVRLEAGQPAGQLARFEVSTDETYISALTEVGWWINVWTSTNWKGRPVPNGIWFVDLQRTPKTPPVFDTDRFQYTGVVRHFFNCPFWSLPFPNGEQLRGERLEAGQSTGPLLRFEISADGTYVSALTEIGWWINVWTRCNRNRRPVPNGIWFVDVQRVHPNPPGDHTGQDHAAASSSSNSKGLGGRGS